MKTAVKQKWRRKPLGKTHIHKLNKVPRELYFSFKTALKDMLGSITMNDYLRVCVAADARIQLTGKPKASLNDSRYQGMLDWGKYRKYVKDPKDLLNVQSNFNYREEDWPIFLENCRIRGEQPKHRLQHFMLDFLKEYRMYKGSK